MGFSSASQAARNSTWTCCASRPTISSSVVSRTRGKKPWTQRLRSKANNPPNFERPCNGDANASGDQGLMPHIEVRDVTLVYDTPAGRVAAVEGATFAIEASEFLCLVGPSGCG